MRCELLRIIFTSSEVHRKEVSQTAELISLSSRPLLEGHAAAPTVQSRLGGRAAAAAIVIQSQRLGTKQLHAVLYHSQAVSGVERALGAGVVQLNEVFVHVARVDGRLVVVMVVLHTTVFNHCLLSFFSTFLPVCQSSHDAVQQGASSSKHSIAT